MSDVCWDGVTRAETLHHHHAQYRHRIADAAKAFDWPTLLELVTQLPGSVNLSRPDGSAWYAPLHQAAHVGASAEVVERLLALGAWRTLRCAKGQRPVDIARERGHRHLLDLLEPQLRHTLSQDALRTLEGHFHGVVLARASHLVREHKLRLPELEPLLELEAPRMWFPVPGMHGGFDYNLDVAGAEPKLLCSSHSRIVGGSGQHHEITLKGSQLIEQGFV